jgi:type VI secretion system secreted protein VgrG
MNQARPTPPLPFVDDPHEAARREFVTRVRLARELRSGALAIRDHDFRNPAFPLLVKARRGSAPEDRLEQYRYQPGAFLIIRQSGDGGTPAADDRGIARHDARFGAARAERALLGERAGARLVSFRTNAIDLQPGTVFSIDDHPHPALDARHRLLVLSLSVMGTPNGEWIIRCRAVPADQPYRPPLQPIITGRVFNALNPVPVRLPEHNTQSAWRSATTPGGDGFTEPKPWMRRRHVSRMCSRSTP